MQCTDASFQIVYASYELFSLLIRHKMKKWSPHKIGTSCLSTEIKNRYNSDTEEMHLIFMRGRDTNVAFDVQNLYWN